MNSLSEKNALIINEIARNAGAGILNIYNNEDFSKVVDFKADNSPLTLGDKAAHEIIMKGLKEAFPSIPVISEEGKSIPYEVRKDYEAYFLVDPLDGTKEFIKRNGEFTVNIALLVNNKPVGGVVYVPVKEITYFAFEGKAFKAQGNAHAKPIMVNNKKTELVAVQSRSHASEIEAELLAQYDITDTVAVGSSIKFCTVAEGTADIYVRSGPTMEWDTAAGQAVLEGAGGKMLTLDNAVFRYNKENLLNPGFICTGF